MIVRQKENITLWQGAGVHPSSFKCDECQCKYHLVNGETIEYFEDWQSAEGRYCELTGTEKFQLGKTNWN